MDYSYNEYIEKIKMIYKNLKLWDIKKLKVI